MNRTFVLCFAPLLAACNSGLGGYWSGQVTCGEYSEGSNELDVELSRLQAGTYTGDLLIESESYYFIDGSLYEYWTEVSLDLSVTIDGKAAQRLDYSADLVDMACQYWLDGDLQSTSCEEIGMLPPQTEGLDVGTWRWDGDDEVTISDDPCSGRLTR